MDMLNPDTFNKEILQVWKNYSGCSKYFPMIYPKLKSNPVLFVGINPSISSQAFSSVKDYLQQATCSDELKKIKSQSELVNFLKYNVHNVNDRRVKDIACLENLFRKHYKYFDGIRRIAGDDWEHVDLFFCRTTKEKDLGLLKDEKLTPFHQAQFDVTKKLVTSLNPRIVIIINALASRIFAKTCAPGIINDINWDEMSPQDSFFKTHGFYGLKLSSRMVPLFFSSMLTGGQLDRGSRQRLVWHINQALKFAASSNNPPT